jgi:hypothetical protein
VASFLQLFAALFAAYALCGVIYVARLYWPIITARLNWLIAPLCVLAFWPAVLWAEAEHAIEERLRQRAYQVPSKEYLQARADLRQARVVADLAAARERRERRESACL